MIIGIPTEIKDDENRVALSPSGVLALIQAGHKVKIQNDAGIGSGFANELYLDAGAEILDSAEEVWSQSEMVMKVKEPLPEEFLFFREGLIIFTYLHLAPLPDLTKSLMDNKTIAIAYETIQLPGGALPLLSPMSEVAGRMAVQVGAQFLEKPNGGKGTLLGGIPGVSPGKVVIIGGGIVGTNAAKMAIGLGAKVTILDINLDRLRYLDDLFENRLQGLISNEYNIAQEVRDADLVIGAVLVPGAKTPQLVTEEMVNEMTPGSVLVDVAIDQGGSIATMDQMTTHSDPIYIKHNVLHYAVANMPGAVPRTSTIALTNVTVPYALQIANKGFRKAVTENDALAKGVNVIEGSVTYEAVAKDLQLSFTPLTEVLDELG